MSITVPNDQGYSSFPATLPPYVGAVMFETFLYGLYSILFAICLYVLSQRKRTAHWILLTFAIAMFTVATTDMVYTYYLIFAKLFKGGLSFTELRPKYWFYVTNNVLADTLLLYRCYAIWGYKLRVVLGPIILLVAGTACGYIFEGSQPHLFKYAWIYPTLTLILNLILTALTAGRIGWFARNAQVLLGQNLVQRYNATVAILIESGFIYSLYIGLDLATMTNKVGHAILDTGLIQVVGIVPTLIIVQVGLGREVHNLEANTPNSMTPFSAASQHTNTVESVQNALPSLRKDCHCASNDTFVYHPDLER